MAGVLPRRDGHSSGTPVAGRLEQPTRATRPTDEGPRENPRVAPIRSCSRRGLPCRRRCRLRGALLPHPFTLTRPTFRPAVGGLLSVALSLGSPPPDVIRRRIRMEPGLSSAPSTGQRRRPSGRLARTAYERGSGDGQGEKATAGIGRSGAQVVVVVHCSFTWIMGMCRASRRLACARWRPVAFFGGERLWSCRGRTGVQFDENNVGPFAGARGRRLGLGLPDPAAAERARRRRARRGDGRAGRFGGLERQRRRRACGRGDRRRHRAR